MSTKTNFGDVDVAAGSITAEEIGSGAATAGHGIDVQNSAFSIQNCL